MSFRARETRYLSTKKNTIFATFDLQYLDSRIRDSMRLLSQLIKCRNKDLYKFVAYYLSFRGLPLFSPYLTGLHTNACSVSTWNGKNIINPS
jgi:hypothetical protein